MSKDNLEEKRKKLNKPVYKEIKEKLTTPKKKQK
jgi:hypothetical protein